MIRVNRWWFAECDAPKCGAETPKFSERDWLLYWLLRNGWYQSCGRCYCTKHVKGESDD